MKCGPDVCEGVGFYGFVEKVLVWKNGLNVQHALDVAKVFFAFAFPVKNHFPEDNVFGWGNVDCAEGRLLDKTVLPSPGEGGVAIAGVEICFEPCWDMDDIEVAAAIACNFRGDHIGRRTIKLGFLKKGQERGDVFETDKQRDIDIEREAGFAVVHGTDRSSNNVAETGIVDGTHEEGEEIRFWRGRIHGQRVFGVLLR